MYDKKTIRIVVCGDEDVGKSSLITSLVKDTFVENIENVVPPVIIPRDFSSSPYSANSTYLIDTSSDDLENLQNEIRNADVIWLVYSDHYTYERISLYWMVMLRSMGVNLPIVLCANKCDEDDSGDTNIIRDDFIPLLQQYKEIESAIRCSAANNHNVVQCFYLCQRAVIHPLSPLYDSQNNELKHDLVQVLTRIFFLCDRDQDGFLNDQELFYLQLRCFNKNLDSIELQKIKNSVNAADSGLSVQNFIDLNRNFIESGRHETTWSILRSFHYTDSLSLDPEFLFPKFEVPENSTVELSQLGYRFLVDLFILFDKDNDGELDESELGNLFKPTPGIPKLWKECNFPQSTVMNEQGFITLQGWLAQWSMSTYLDYKITLQYFAYLGFENLSNRFTDNDKVSSLTYSTNRAIYNFTSSSNSVPTTTTALKITKPRKFRRINGKTYRTPVNNNRTVFNCLVLGSPGCGKSSLLDTFLQRPYNENYIPTMKLRTVVNSVEVKGGKQHYLIMEELGSQLESEILNKNANKLKNCDVVCLVYDSSNPESFQYLVEFREANPYLDGLPLIFVALKADLDRQQQRTAIQPETYTKDLQLNPPLHVSCNWPSSVTELFLQLVDAAQFPNLFTPNIREELQEDELDNFKNFVAMASTLGVISIASAYLWKMVSRNK